MYVIQQDSDVDVKKTDAVVEDDPHQSDNEEEPKEAPEKPSKGGLEEPSHEPDSTEVILFHYIYKIDSI